MGIDRRTFLANSLQTGGSAIAAAICSALFATGCSTKQTLQVRVLKGSIPVPLISSLQHALPTDTSVKLIPASQLATLFESINRNGSPTSSSRWKWRRTPSNPAPPADLMTLGDAWLSQAIADGLIQPLDVSQFNLELSPPWNALVQRDDSGQLDPQGKIWGIPYSWGTTALVYNPRRFKSLGWKPTDWSDLWRPELKGRISLLDNPRETIGLTLKYLGYSYNQENLNEISDLAPALKALDRQALLYSSTQYLQPLIEGDSWIAVGWSTDILPILQRYGLNAIIPQSGTSLWANVWVHPTPLSADTALNPAIVPWIDRFWAPEFAKQLSHLSDTVSPLLTGLSREEIPESVLKNPVKLPVQEILNRSEFLLPLSAETNEMLQKLWQQMRSHG
ncbi:extracellular solute-binding protein [Roseofilum casamattae]|uniref:Extracellular solute-binding protein n=1 Tax=Roseofilum casamattae BLCC-M143 TaxID=3022442 RepID=A0ABT7BUN4_9CYAN|nr:extracellular solute-binding protein [Roseofilum casamattae]MDJ1182497.1 extracellular solute-binding protein [Roseofilum casamattae BLCC-M143]